MSMELYNGKKIGSTAFCCHDLDTADGGPVLNGTAVVNAMYSIPVYNTCTLQYNEVLGSIQTGRVSGQFDGVKHDTTHVSQSEHSDRPRHSAATAACVGIRSIIDALLNRYKEMSQSEVVSLFLMPTIITE